MPELKQNRWPHAPEVLRHLLGLGQDGLNSIGGDKVFVAMQAQHWGLSLQGHCWLQPHLLCGGLVS